ncbi:MAG: hypothetical protein ACPG4N_02170 [Gammaproteobacteria bacterium]
MKKLLWIILIGFVIYWLLIRDNAVTQPDGVLAPEQPRQTAPVSTAPFQHKGHSITPLADFQITARVLSVEHYGLDRESELSPVDLALGWGPMSDNRVIQEIDISQRGRWYYWQVEGPTIALRQIELNSANMHMIPANDTVETLLERVREGQVVTIEGKLIEARTPDGWRWRSSLTRADTGARACEVVWVDHIYATSQATPSR